MESLITYYQKTVKELDKEKEKAKKAEFEFDQATGSYKDRTYEVQGWKSVAQATTMLPMYGVSVHKIPLFSILQGDETTCYLISSILALGNLIWQSPEKEINPLSVVLPKGYLDQEGIFGACFLDRGELKTVFMDDRFEEDQLIPNSRQSKKPNECPRLLFTSIIEKGFFKLKKHIPKRGNIYFRADSFLHSITGAPAEFLFHQDMRSGGDLESRFKSLIASRDTAVFIGFVTKRESHEPWMTKNWEESHVFAIMAADSQGCILLRDPLGYITGDVRPTARDSLKLDLMKKEFGERMKIAFMNIDPQRGPAIVLSWDEYLKWFQATAILHYNPKFQFSSNQIQLKFIPQKTYNVMTQFKTLTPWDTEVPEAGSQKAPVDTHLLFYNFQLVSEIPETLPIPAYTAVAEAPLQLVKYKLPKNQYGLTCDIDPISGSTKDVSQFEQTIQYWGMELQEGKTYKINFSVRFGQCQGEELQKEQDSVTKIGIVFYGQNKVKVLNLTITH